MRNWIRRFWSESPRRNSWSRRRSPLRLEQLEDRLAPAVILTVTTAADDNTPGDGSVSLREAIQAINAATPPTDPDIIAEIGATPTFGPVDTINFNISASGTVQTINVGGTGNGALPALLKPVTINGYSERGASMNTLANGDNAKILIELNGANAGPNADGILLGATSAGSTIEGLAINRFSLNGIELQSGGDVIAGNFVGTNPRGNAAEPNQNDGIHLSNSSSSTIGGTTPGARNLASGNQIDGIHVVGSTASPATGNTIEGNFVGVNAAGTGFVGLRPNGSAAGTAEGNGVFGIEISGGNANTVGGTTPADRNVVGFSVDGIEIDNGGEDNVIQGNFSGVGADGVTPAGNVLHGIALRSDDNLSPPLGPGQANEPAVSGNIIGLNPNISFSGLGNLVEFNGAAGIAVFGNPPQNNAVQAQNSGNSILGNSIFENGRNNPTSLLGIDLTNQFVFPKDDGVTPNDGGKNTMGKSAPHGDPSNPNNFQNFPVLTSAVPVTGGIQITGTLTQSVSANVMYRIEFFVNNPDPQGGIPEGQTLLGATNVTTSAAGKASFSLTLNVSVAAGQIITADATNLTADPSSPAGSVNLFNTSEFSAGVFAGTPDQVFVIKVYRDLLGRLPDAGGLAFWSGLLDQGLPRSQMVLAIETDSAHEYYSKLVASFYQFYLHRTEGAGDQGAATGLVNFLAAGGAIEQVRAFFTSSPEYFITRGGGTGSGFVNALYLDAFNTPNRVASDPGAAAFAQAISNGTLTTAQVSASIFASNEFRADLVQSYYQQFLNRSGTAAEINAWVSQLAAGVMDQQVIALILGSLESFEKPPGA